MTYHTQISTVDAAPYTTVEHEAYLQAYSNARIRAAYSYFDQHIIRMDDGSYWVADEGSYETLMQDLVDRVVHTVAGGLMDET